MSEESALLWILATITLVVFAFGTAVSAFAWARGKAPLAGVTVLFALGLARQIALLFDAQATRALAESALLGLGCAAFVALRALRRTTRERDRAEDLHWDAMETVRTMTELAAGPSSDLDARLETVLALGATRFGLEHAVAWSTDGEPGRALFVHSQAGCEPADALPISVERLQLAAQSDRPLVLIDAAPSQSRVFFGASVRIGDSVRGCLGFAGSTEPKSRFAATDKDLINLMAQWLATELERQERTAATRAEVPTPTAAAPAPAPIPPAATRRVASARPPSTGRRGGDLNAAIQRSEAKLRRRLGADATLELALEPTLPRTQVGRVSLPALVESLVAAAARLAPSGRIHIQTAALAPVRSADGSVGTSPGDITLAVSVEGDGIDAAALAKIFETPVAGESPETHALPLAQLERLLQHGSGALSVSLEPPRRAILTAFVPALATEDGTSSRVAPRPQSSR